MYPRGSSLKRGQPKLSEKNAWLRQILWHAAAAIVLLFAVHLLYIGLGGYSDSYDAGVYLESARMMGRGFAPYGQIFNSQPPLWLPLIYVAFRLFGESFLAGQLVTATAGLIVIAAVMLITKQMAGRASAILAGTLVMYLRAVELIVLLTNHFWVSSAAAGYRPGGNVSRTSHPGLVVATELDACSCPMGGQAISAPRRSR